MNVTTWDDDVSLRQTNEWLAELRDDRQAEPPGADTRPARGAAPPARPAFPVHAAIPGQRRAFGQATDAPWASAPAPAGPGARAIDFPAPAGAAASVTSIPSPAGTAAPVTVRAAIGDELRRPIMWCEMASCINYHADPSALGEADARARAVRAGWCIDAVGRLACPQCQQTTSFWTPRPVVPWDRATALVMTTLAAVRAGLAGGRQQREQEQEQQAWHHEQPWGHGARHSRPTPARPYISPA
ncbi:MAG: hypothetical protein ACLP5E_05625 [Streptosporangiaceae bacterium]